LLYIHPIATLGTVVALYNTAGLTSFALYLERGGARIATENTPDPTAPDTIVLVHGLWVTPRSWEHWIEHYEGRGYRVLAPAYPGFEVEVESLNEDPSPIEALTIPAVVEHYEGIIGELDKPPILMATPWEVCSSRSCSTTDMGQWVWP
jgi:hypothetical protein